MNKENRTDSLKNIYWNKDLSRSERREAMNNYIRDAYKRDPRKSISVGKQTLIDAVTSLIMSLNFLFMGCVENLGIKIKYHDIISPIESGFLLLMAACLVIYIYTHSKFKLEPDDELSQKNKLTAKSCGLIFVSFVLFAAIIIYFPILGNETFVLKHEAAIFLFAGFLFFSKFIDGMTFLILEGKTGTADEDEVEE